MKKKSIPESLEVRAFNKKWEYSKPVYVKITWEPPKKESGNIVDCDGVTLYGEMAKETKKKKQDHVSITYRPDAKVIEVWVNDRKLTSDEYKIIRRRDGTLKVKLNSEIKLPITTRAQARKIAKKIMIGGRSGVIK